MRDHLRDRAVAVAWEDTVHVCRIDRRGSPPGEKGGKVQTRNDDQTSVDLHRRQALQQLHQCDGTFVLVAVIAARPERGGTVTVLEHGDWNGDVPIGRAVHRMRHTQRAGLKAFLFEIDVRRDAGTVVYHCSSPDVGMPRATDVKVAAMCLLSENEGIYANAD